MTQYVLLKRDLYENPGHQGYTGIRDKAGTWPLSLVRTDTIQVKDAYDPACRDSYAIPFDVAPEFTNECFHDLSLAHLRGKIEELSAENRRLQVDASKHAADAETVRRERDDEIQNNKRLREALMPFTFSKSTLSFDRFDDENAASVAVAGAGSSRVGFFVGDVQRARKAMKEAA